MTDDKLCPSCREPLDYPNGEGCANMTAHESSEPFQVVVTNVEEHEDGAATYSFELDDRAKEYVANIGLEFMLYCAAYELDLQYALDNLKHLAKEESKSEDSAA